MSSIKANLMAFLSMLLGFIVPKAFKRLIFISTLYTKGGEEKLFTEIDYTNLNKEMNIATDYKAIKSAICLKDVVWKDVEISSLINSIGCPMNGEEVPQFVLDEAAEKILDSVPAWVRYNRNEMVTDIRRLLCDSHAFA